MNNDDTDTNISYNPDCNNASAGIAAGIDLAAVEQRLTDLGGIPLALVPSGMSLDVLTRVLDEQDKRAEAPRRLKGTATLSELDSFIAHVNRFKGESSAIFADVVNVRLTAVLNYHDATGPHWSDHRSLYACPLSAEWKLWKGKSGVPFGQEEFGDFLEANAKDLAEPTAGIATDAEMPQSARLLEMARNLVIRTKGAFERSINPTTGEGALICKTEHEATSTKIPRAFLLGIPVFDAGTPYRIEARLRFTLRESRPTFTYELYQPDQFVRDAFGSVRSQVLAQTALPIYAGAPEQ